MKTRIFHSKTLKSLKLVPAESLLFYDSVLDKNPAFRTWRRKFVYSFPLKAGEDLKTLKSFEKVLNNISESGAPTDASTRFVAVGGGSVTDFVGFVASVYHRGRSLILIPSTWLSAVDSAHGGKNGLNFNGVKNQIGSFYNPEAVHICDELLLSQPHGRLTESLGEIIKIALLSDAKLFAGLEKSRDVEFVLSNLKLMIKHKYKIVESDPLEKNGTRRLLNLGHTIGHVIESYFKWPHGVCVLLGLQFSARWSFALGYLGETEFIRISLIVDEILPALELNATLQKIPIQLLKGLLLKDKKSVGSSKLDFIFLKGIGKPVRKTVSTDDIVAEVSRQLREM